MDNSRTHQENLAPENFDLARVHALMARLGDPHMQYRVVHVAGTKGKGSVAALCASALHAAGFRVGLNTSPHLQDFTERIQVDGKPIPPGKLVKLVDKIKPHVAAIPRLTTFEIGTALALWHFARREVDFAVLEVGLGGRLDATNVVTPEVSIITTISLDHTPILGSTIREIAAEKAGIIKEGAPVVSAPQPPEAHQTIAQMALAHGAPLTTVGEDFRFRFIKGDLSGQRFWVWPAHEQPQADNFLEGRQTGKWSPTVFELPLLGAHQVENAATAFAALQVLRAQGVKISEAAIRRGFGRVNWPGRFEILQNDPLVILDAAHNTDSARRLRQTLDDYLPDRPIVLVLGVSADKNLGGMLEALGPRVVRALATRSIHPRAMPPGELAAQVEAFGLPVEPVESVEAALPLALEWAAREGGAVLVTGSVFLVGAVREVGVEG